MSRTIREKRQLEEDPWSTEVLMAAKARAHCEIAAPRFTDSICQQMEARLMPEREQSLVPNLTE